MGLMLMVTGIFAGIAVFLATLYSLTQSFLAEGHLRRAHLLSLLGVLAIMLALQYREIWLARLLALPLIGFAAWAMAGERRWYRLFPLLHQLFAVVLLAGWVAL